MRNRAYRRWQAQKKKNKVRNYFVCEYGKDDPSTVGFMARTPAPCSCMMCGNPRKYWRELTIQERRAA